MRVRDALQQRARPADDRGGGSRIERRVDDVPIRVAVRRFPHPDGAVRKTRHEHIFARVGHGHDVLAAARPGRFLVSRRLAVLSVWLGTGCRGELREARANARAQRRRGDVRRGAAFFLRRGSRRSAFFSDFLIFLHKGRQRGHGRVEGLFTLLDRGAGSSVFVVEVVRVLRRLRVRRRRRDVPPPGVPVVHEPRLLRGAVRDASPVVPARELADPLRRRNSVV
mmetsp:Transcript_3030/g.12561  ORF Transcript_3030/g.12561 Transcript_3030/m.12561 type:complete len:224 (-) Transcript_3030:211-882(-)